MPAVVTAADGVTPGVAPAVLVMTLDPWRDTPTRLPSIARAWELPDEAFVLSGRVADVEAALDRWDVPRGRDPRTDEIAHPALAYVIDARGRVAYAVTAHAGAIAQLLARL